MKWRNRGKPFAVILTILLLLFLLFPFLVMLSTMLKTSHEVYEVPPSWLPRKPQLVNLVRLWSEFDFGVFFKSSLIIAFGTTIMNTLITLPAAYAVARLRFVGRRVILYLLLVIQMFSPTIAFTIWMMNGYFRSIPVDIEEAALIDGCTRVQTITRIMIPIAVPGLVTTMIYSFIAAWNEFLFGLTFIQSREKMPLVLSLYNFVGRWTTQWELLNAAAFVALVPVLVLFYVIERRLVAGLAGGAIKA
jgi:multiple sugar transport system permease protein